MNGLILHCGAKASSYEEVQHIPLPEVTRSYQPLAHHHMIDMIHNSVEKVFGKHALTENALGVSANGDKMFGVMTIALDSAEHTVALGYRNDYGKDLSAGVVGGGRMIVCDNLAFNGSGVNLFRKHTTNIYRDIPLLIDNAITLSKDEYRVISESWDRMKTVPVNLDQGYEKIGLAQGHKVLSSRQATVAYGEWEQPSHPEFEDRNLFSLHQAFTEAAKSGAAEGIMQRYPRINRFFDIPQVA